MCKTGCLEKTESPPDVDRPDAQGGFFVPGLFSGSWCTKFGGAAMIPDTRQNLPVDHFRHIRPYATEIVLKTFIVRDNQEPQKPLVLGPEANGSDDAARIARAIYDTLDADKEHFVVLALNQKNRLIGYKHVSTGTLTASLVHPREVFTAALELRAAALIFVHNHPSCDPLPSSEDIEVTRRLKRCGGLLGFRILDHVILGREEIYSFSDRGGLPI
jgi:DNA repair protein RadC